MASAITHFIVGAAVSLPFLESRPARSVLSAWSLPITAGLLAVAPDLDTYIARLLLLPHDSPWSHRGILHSPFFLILLCAVLAIALILRRRRDWRAWASMTAVWSIAAITHPLLDMLTDGGSGAMVLYPLSHARYFFPWHPIRVSPLSVTRFFTRAGPILRSEAPFDIGAVLVGVAGWIARRMGGGR